MFKDKILNCIICGREFRAGVNAVAECCGDECADIAEEMSWSGQKKAKKKEERKIASERLTRISQACNEISLEKKPEKSTEKISKKVEREIEKDTGNIENQKINVKDNGQTIIKVRSMNTEETTIKEIEKDYSNKSMQDDIDETRSMVLRKSQGPLSKVSENLSEETSHSMSLLKETQNELLYLMKGLTRDQINKDINLHDVDRVRAAAECAKQINSSLRMQLDIYRFAKELSDEKRKLDGARENR